MKRICILFIVCLALIWLGCPARSIFPLLTPAEHSFLPGLSGKWINGEADSRDTLTFADSDGEYLVKNITESEGTTEYRGYTGQLGDHWYLDTYPKMEEFPEHMLPVHMLHQLRVEGDTLRIGTLEADWLRDLKKRQELKLPHVVRDEEVILTASTAELQAFVQQHAMNPAAFPNPAKYWRVR